jgi:FAD/FMN-containing dehydrogenase
MGLTGFIVSARLRLMRLSSRYMRMDRLRGSDLATTLRLLTESSRQYRYSVAWMDGLAAGRFLGRSVITRGDHATSSQLAENPGKERLASEWSLRVPWALPITSLHRFAGAAFNELYYRGIREVRDDLVRCERFFYPLDRIRDWNLLYGKRGLVQYQFVVPPENAEEAIRAVLERLAAAGQRTLLAVMKVFGDAGHGLLSFPRRGFTLSLDLPVNHEIRAVLSELDEIVLRYGGRVYLAKDAALSAESFTAMYPNADRFRAIKRRLDPESLLSSSLARRIGLVEAA